MFTTATKALTVLETSCDTIHLTWKAPVNTGGWSPVTDYAVYIELAEAVPFEDLLPSATDDASVKPLPHRMVARKTEILLTGLAEATEYVVMVLPRNLKGWGAKWSAPLRVATDEALLPPLKANAPAIRPDSTCGEAEVRIPAAAPTGACRAPNEYLLQVLADVSDGWVTLEHSVPGSIAHISGINADASFVVRLVAMNAYGTAPPSDSTALTPGPFGGCVSERPWTEESADGDAVSVPHGLTRRLASGLAALLVLGSCACMGLRSRRTASYGKLTMASAMDETTMDDGDGFDDDECSDPDGIDDDLGLNDFFVKADAGTMERGGNALATRSFRVSVSGEDDDDDEHGDGGRGGANGEAEMLSMLDDAGEEALLARVNAVLISTGAAPLNGMQTTTAAPPAAGGQGEANELWTETEDVMYEL